MSVTKAPADQPDTPEARLRATYFSLFHEMQFRCTKNALMNYHQAEIFEGKGDMWKRVTSFFTVASATGVFAGVIQNGKVLASKMGMAGLVGLPICGIMQLVGSSTSELVPSYYERAKKHTGAAAGWMQIAETARVVQLRIKIDPTFDLEIVSRQYDELVNRKEIISKEVLIPRDTHKHYHGSTEMVYLAMAKRQNAFQEFLDLEVKHSNIITQIKNAEDIYF